MGAKRKKIGAAGKYGAGHGRKVRNRFNAVEKKQRVSQPSPFHPTGKAKRVAVGIWRCLKTGKIFAGPAYHLHDAD